jgi:heme o synthase
MAPSDRLHRPDPAENHWPNRLAWALAIAVFPLIWMGGTVTTYDAGMAVPDWPTTYQYWFYPIKLWLAVWDVFLEHGHRLLGQLAGALAILLAVAIWRLDDRKWMRWVGVAVVAGVIAQGALGGWRVLADERLLARIHGCTAPLYFGLCTAVVAWTSRQWRLAEGGKRKGEGGRRKAEDTSPSIKLPHSAFLPWLVTAAIYLEIVLGAQLRRPSADAAFGGATLPEWMKTLCFGQAATWFELWVWLKVINAGLIALGVVWLVAASSRRLNGRSVPMRRAWWLAAIVTVQLVLAATTWVTNYGWPAWFTGWIWPLQSAVLAQGQPLVLLTTAHAAVGSLCFVASLSLSLWLWRTVSVMPREVLPPTCGDDMSRLCFSITSGVGGNAVMLKHNLRLSRPFRCVWDYFCLVRPRIVALALLAMAVSAEIAVAGPPSWPTVAHALLGAALVVGGAGALNQRLEYMSDAMMPRTANRPLPAGRLSLRHGTLFGLAATAAGLLYLAIASNMSVTLLAGVGWLLYVCVYTPLKTRSVWQTPIGALAGAMPVLLGAAAVGGLLSPWTLTSFGVVYLWQIPHSMAIAWRYRREFATAGVKVAAVTDPSGQTAGIWAVLAAAALMPVGLTPWLLSLTGAAYCAAGLVLGTAYLAASAWFAFRPDDLSARRLLLASLIYLPAMLAALILA